MSVPSAIQWSEVHRQLAENERRLEQALHPTPEAARAILAKRAAVVRENCAPQRLLKTDQLLVVRAGNEYLALPLPALAEVLPLQQCTPVPGAPPEVLGIVSVRGDLHSVIDPRFAFASGTPVPLELHYGLVLRHALHRVVLGVSAVLEIHAVPAGQGAADDEMLAVREQMVRRLDVAACLRRVLATEPPLPLIPTL